MKTPSNNKKNTTRKRRIIKIQGKMIEKRRVDRFRNERKSI